MKLHQRFLRLAATPLSSYALMVRLRHAMRGDMNQVGLRGSTAELVARQISKDGFRRLDLVILFLAIKHAHQDGEAGVNGLMLMEKLLDSMPRWNPPARALLSLLKRGRINEVLYLPENLFVNESLDIPHDICPLAVAVYFNQHTINLNFVRQGSCPCYDRSWLQMHSFSTSEIDQIMEAQNEIFSKLKLLPVPWESRLEIRQRLNRLLPKNSTLHGRGSFYQSCQDLLISGQRPTELRFQAYQLQSILKPTDRVLDIGCNCGFFSLYVSKYVATVEGFDIDPSFIAIANGAKIFLQKENCRFLTSSFQEFHAAERFDVILSFAVHHWVGLPIRAYASQLREWLKPGGIILIESQDLNTHDAYWNDKVNVLCSMNFEVIKRGHFCDDGQLVREFLFLKDKRNLDN